MSEQPPPIPGFGNVTPVARQLFLETLAQQEQKGIATYGTTLQAGNGRDALADALDELVDAVLYIVQAQMERERARELNQGRAQAEQALVERVIQAEQELTAARAAAAAWSVAASEAGVQYQIAQWEQASDRAVKAEQALAQAEQERDAARAALARAAAASRAHSAAIRSWVPDHPNTDWHARVIAAREELHAALLALDGTDRAIRVDWHE